METSNVVHDPAVVANDPAPPSQQRKQKKVHSELLTGYGSTSAGKIATKGWIYHCEWSALVGKIVVTLFENGCELVCLFISHAGVKR
jgi:hypothetical protein